MREITYAQFQGTTAELQARVAAFLQALEDHKLTEGVPAPREDELVEELARSGEPFIVLAPPSPPTEEEAAALEAASALEAKRLAALYALDLQRLTEALADPACPQEVKDYDAALKASTP